MKDLILHKTWDGEQEQVKLGGRIMGEESVYRLSPKACLCNTCQNVAPTKHGEQGAV